MTQMPLPNFWPDNQGALKLPSARAWKRHLPRRRSLANWMIERAPGLVGFGPVRSILFAAWLRDALLEADYQCLTIGAVMQRAVIDLRIERQEAIRLLVEHTSARADFRSDGQVVTLRE